MSVHKTVRQQSTVCLFSTKGLSRNDVTFLGGEVSQKLTKSIWSGLQGMSPVLVTKVP